MIQGSKQNLFQAVVIYSVDRFSRSMHQSAMYANELEKNGVMLISATEHISGGASGKLTLNMLMAFAQYYSDELSQKISRGMDYNAERGYSLGGIAPLGYKKEADDSSKDGKKRFVVDDSTAPIVMRIFEMYADEGIIMAEIIRYLNEQGYKTSNGKPFNKNSIRKILLNKKYIGIYAYRGKEFSNLVPRIIDDDLFERAGQELKKNQKATARNKAIGENEYLLTLRLFCGHCKELMTGWSGTGKAKRIHRYYMCNGKKKKLCNKKNVRKKSIEDTVIYECRKILTDENIEKIANEVIAYNESEQQNNDNLKRLEKLISDNEKQKSNLMDTLKLCEDEDTKRMILSELSQMGKTAKDLQIQLAIEESRKVRITRREIVFFLKDLQNGDVSDVKYRKTLIRVLIDKIYLYDDGRLTIIFYNGDKTIEIDVNLIDEIERDIPVEEGCYFMDDSAPPRICQDQTKKIFVWSLTFIEQQLYTEKYLIRICYLSGWTT